MLVKLQFSPLCVTFAGDKLCLEIKYGSSVEYYNVVGNKQAGGVG